MKNRSTILLVACILIGIILITRYVYAQSAQSQCVVTQVGSPADKPTLPPGCNGGGSVGGIKPPDYPADLKQAIKDKFDVSIKGDIDQTHLKWIWEKLWDVSNTNFPKLVKGAVILSFPPPDPPAKVYSRQVGCAPPRTNTSGNSIELGEYSGEDIYKFLFTHELGHLIQNCYLREVNHVSEHLQAIATEGYVSFYGEHAKTCSGGKPEHEDYADTVAYYLNPQAGLVSISHCQNDPQPPETHPKNPLFQLLPPKTEHFKVMDAVMRSSL